MFEKNFYTCLYCNTYVSINFKTSCLCNCSAVRVNKVEKSILINIEPIINKNCWLFIMDDFIKCSYLDGTFNEKVLFIVSDKNLNILSYDLEKLTKFVKNNLLLS